MSLCYLRRTPCLHIWRFGIGRAFHSSSRSLGTPSLTPTSFGLKTIYSGDGSPDVDIVAVHGLGANPDKTWNYNAVVGTNASQTSSSSDVNLSNANSTMWLKDLLPQHVPKARIMAFNYASEWLRNAPRESMRPLANRLLANIDDSRQALEIKGKAGRPIIFIGHSFGGLLIEEALAIAKHDQKYHHLLQNTYGAIFLGTPHRGADLASWGDTLATCAAAFGLGPDTELLNILRKDSDRLREIFNDFAVLANEMSLDLVCFFELYPTVIKYRRGVLQYLISAKTMVVDRFSATIDGYRHYALHANHCTMNKFESKEDANFKLVAYKIREFVTKAPKVIEERYAQSMEANTEVLPERSRYFVVANSENKNYIPRPSVDQNLQTLLEAYPQRDAQVRIALYGLEGSGKTQHALNFAYRQKSSRNVFWVNGETELTFQTSYAALGKAVNLISGDIPETDSETCMIVREWLGSPRSGKWILVVDGIGDLSDSFLEYCNTILPDRRGIIIFTSSNTNVIGNLVPLGFGMEVGPMSESTAEAMFRRLAGHPEIDLDKLKPLLEVLGYLPLAIAHAAAFIRENHISIHNYINTFRDSDDDLKQRLLSEPTQSTPQQILRTWDINFQYIRNKDRRASKLLKLMSQFDLETSRELLRSPRLEEFDLHDDLIFDKCMGLLISYALVTPVHSRNSYRLHPLVGLRTRQKVQDKLLFQEVAINIINDAFPSDQYSANYGTLSFSLLPHAETILSTTKGNSALDKQYDVLKGKMEMYKQFVHESYLNNGYLNKWAD